MVRVTLRVWKHAVAAGRVSDESGQPVIGATVNALRQAATGGRLRWETARSVRTNDRGSYRLPDLLPGRYRLAVVAQSAARPSLPGQSGGFPTTFLGGSVSLEGGLVVDLASGEVREGLDFDLRLDRTFDVSGRVDGLEPGTTAAVEIREAGSPPELIDLVFDRMTTAEDGRFSFARVPIGQYEIRVTAAPRPNNAYGFQTRDGVTAVGFSRGSSRPLDSLPDGGTRWAQATLVVTDQGSDELILALRAGGRFVGRVLFEGTAAPPPAETLVATPVFVQSADGRDLGTFPLARIEPDGRFRTAGLPPGSYMLLPMVADGRWIPSSIVVNGRETIGRALTLADTDVHATITLADGFTEITGVVRDGAGRSTGDAFVYAFPRDPSGWVDFGRTRLAVRDARPDDDGAYAIPYLPPGEYLVRAVSSVLGDDWCTTETLRHLSTEAASLRLEPGEKRRLDLVVR